MSRVPPRWASFPIQRMVERDSSSALYCIAAAAIYLGTLKDKDDGGKWILMNAEAASFSKGRAYEKVVRKLADAAWLDLFRPNRRAEGLDDLAYRSDRPGDETLWIALLKANFPNPAKRKNARPDLHYVLVLDVIAKGIVVADPHPGRKPLHVMGKEPFLAAWSAARAHGRPGWAGCLGRRKD